VRFWGLEASYAFIEQPQTNGVAERFFKTLKEQIIHGRIYRTVAELRAAVEAFVELYNEQWLPEKNGYLSPSATRAAWYAQHGTEVAAQGRSVSRYPRPVHCTSATTAGEASSSTMSQPAPTTCMKAPMFEASRAIQSAR